MSDAEAKTPEQTGSRPAYTALEIEDRPIGDLSIRDSDNYFDECSKFSRHGAAACLHLARSFVLCCSPVRCRVACCDRMVYHYVPRIGTIMINIACLLYTIVYLHDLQDYEWKDERCIDSNGESLIIVYIMLLISYCANIIFGVCSFGWLYVITVIGQIAAFLEFVGYTMVPCNEDDDKAVEKNYDDLSWVFLIQYLPTLTVTILNCCYVAYRYRDRRMLFFTEFGSILSCVEDP
jgi:hypothetical protein